MKSLIQCIDDCMMYGLTYQEALRCYCIELAIAEEVTCTYHLYTVAR